MVVRVLDKLSCYTKRSLVEEWWRRRRGDHLLGGIGVERGMPWIAGERVRDLGVGAGMPGLLVTVGVWSVSKGVIDGEVVWTVKFFF